MSEIQEGQFKSPIVKSGINKGRIRNPKVAQEVVNTIFESIKRPKKEQEQQPFILTSHQIDALNSQGNNDVLIRQASKTVKVEEKTLIDQLTGLPNEEGFTQNLTTFMELAKRNHKNILVYMVDLDKFKEINDTYGHNIGSKVLQMFGKLFRNSSRLSDIVSRLHGDEFAILQYNVSEENAEKIRQRINANLQKLKSDLKYGDWFKNVDASIGVVDYQAETDIHPVDLLNRADIAMYNAKTINGTSLVYWKPNMEKPPETKHMR